MRGTSSTSKPNYPNHYYYKCPSKDKKSEKKTHLEEFVVSVVMQTILRASYRDELVDFIIDSGNKIELNIYNEIERLKRLISNNKKKINNLMKAVKAGIISSSLQSELSTLEKQNEMHQLEISKNKMSKALNFDRDKIIFFFDRLSKRKSDDDSNGLIIKTFVKRVTISDDGDMTIECRLPMNNIQVKMPDINEQSVRIGATHLHHNGRNTHTIGFTEPEIYVFRNSIFVCVKIKKEPV